MIYKQLTIAQISAALGWAIIFLYGLVKCVKDFREVKESILYCFTYIKTVWLWTVKKMMWRKQFSELLVGQRILLEKISKEQETIKKELAYNGGSSTKDAVRRIENTLAIVQDVLSENKALRKAQELCSAQMVFRMDENGACIFISDAFLKFFACQLSDVREFGYENMVHEEDVMEMRSKWNKAINTKTSFKDEQRIRHSGSGKYHSVSIQAHPVIIADQLKYFYGTIEIMQ